MDGMIPPRTAVLLVQGDPVEGAVIRSALGTEAEPPLDVVAAESAGAIPGLLWRRRFDAVLVDLGGPGPRDLEGLRLVRSHAPEIPVVVLVRVGDEALGHEAVEVGARDYVVKSPALTATLLARSLRRAAEGQRREAAVEALTRSAGLLATEPDVEPIARRVVAGAADALRARAVRLVLVDRATGTRRLAARQGEPAGADDPLRLDQALALVDLVLHEGRSVWSADLRSDPRLGGASVTPEFDDLRSFTAAPVAARGEVLGVLVAADTVGRVFTAAEIEGLEALAAQAALALRNAELTADGGRRRLQMEHFLAASQAAAGARDRGEALRAIAAELRSSLDADTAGVYLAETDGGLLRAVAMAYARGGLEEAIRNAPIPGGGHPFVEEAWRTGRPSWSGDAGTDPRIDPGLRQRFPHRALLFFPLSASGLVRGGLLAFWWQRVPTPSAEDLAVGEGICRQAAAVVAAARLGEEAEWRRREREGLARVARALSDSPTAVDVAHRLVRGVAEHFQARASGLRLLEPGGALRLAAWWGRRPSHAESDDPLPPGLGVSGRVVATERPVACPDVLAMPDVRLDDVIRRLVTDRGEGAVAGVPLHARGHVIGALTVGDVTGRTFGEHEIALLQAFADQAALALDNARLLEEAGQRQREAETLAAVARSISASLDLDAILDRLIEAARSLCAADVARIALREPGGEDMVFPRWPGAPDPDLAGRRVRPGPGAGGQVLVTGEPFRTARAVDDPRLPPEARDAARAEGLVAQVVMPIRSGDRIEGLLFVGRRAARPFTDRDEAVLLRLADHAAVAIGNSRSYQREREARRAAEASERHTARLFASIPLPMWVYDLTTLRMVEVNPAAVARYGYERKDFLALTVGDLLDPDEVPAWPGAEAAGVLVHSVHRHRDGTRIQVEMVSELLEFAGRPARLVAAVDVTERRRLEEALRQAQRMEAVGRLAGGIAHDFNNLLTVIGGRSGLLVEHLADDPVGRPEAEVVVEAAERAASLTSQLLAFSRQQVLRPTVVDLNVVIGDLDRILQRLIGEDVRLSTVKAADLGRVRADPSRIEQVVLNLALNARDAMPDGGSLTLETANATLEAEDRRRHPDVVPGRYVMLTASDTGAGMDAETLAHIFEPFFTTKARGHGTGLGLSTVYGIVKQSGGHIAVESEPGRGTTFRVYLPCVEEEAAPASGRATSVARGGRESILLVEDDDQVRTLARDVLVASGYEVLMAASGEDALRLAAEWHAPLHLLLTDVVMPGLNGRALAERLTAERPGLRVLYMSGYLGEVVLRHGVAEPDTAFVQKPFSPAVLRQRIREILDAPGPC